MSKIKLQRQEKNWQGFYTYFDGKEWVKFTNRKRYISSLSNFEKSLNSQFETLKLLFAFDAYLLTSSNVSQLKSKIELIEKVYTINSSKSENSSYHLAKLLANG